MLVKLMLPSAAGRKINDLPGFMASSSECTKSGLKIVVEILRFISSHGVVKNGFL